MLTAIIPVKASSERLKNKNLHPFLDTTLYEHKLNQLRKVPFDRVVVSSEDKEILKIAEDFGFLTHHRDPMYSTPNIPMSQVYTYLASEVPGDEIALVNITNPLVEAGHYTRAVDSWCTASIDYDCLLSAYNVQKYLWKDSMPVNFDPFPHPRSQDLQGVCALSFAINIASKANVLKWGTFCGYQPYFFLLDRFESTKIDYIEDLKFCEMMYRKKLYGNYFGNRRSRVSRKSCG